MSSQPARREPAVAGMFYERDPKRLRRQITEGCFLHSLGPQRLPAPVIPKANQSIAIIAPHAGYVYSGPCAAHAYLAASEAGAFDVAVVLGPQHRGFGPAVAVQPPGTYSTPLGDLKVPDEVQRLCEAGPFVVLDAVAHRDEHSIEVQMPFIQYLYEPPPLVIPLALSLTDFVQIHRLAEAVWQVVGERTALLVASTDFTHYESATQAQKKDSRVIERIKAMDPQGVLDTVQREHISMCGYAPVATVLEAALQKRMTTVSQLCYMTSGDVTGDSSSVVAYAAFVVR